MLRLGACCASRVFLELREAKRLKRSATLVERETTRRRVSHQTLAAPALLRVARSLLGRSRSLGLFRIIDPTITCGEAFPWIPEPRNTCRIQRRSILSS